MSCSGSSAWGGVSPESVWRFVHDCRRVAERIAQSGKDVDKELLDVILSAANLSCHVRRSVRRAVSIPVRLCSEKLHDPWEEQTETLVINRYGALIRCQRPFKIDHRLRVVRTDDGRQALARVAWCERQGDAQLGLGLEFLDCDNFWDRPDHERQASKIAESKHRRGQRVFLAGGRLLQGSRFAGPASLADLARVTGWPRLIAP